MKLGDQDKTWAPHKVCIMLTFSLWMKGKKHFSFGVPMVWREPQNHLSDCYFCAVKTTGITSKTRSSVAYPSLPSAIQPVPHSNEVPKPTFHGFHLSESESISSTEESELYEDFVLVHQNDEPQLFTQAELNDLVRKLDLQKISAELLGSRLKEKNLLAPKTKVSFYRYRKKGLMEFFKMEENLLFCNNIEKLITAMGTSYTTSEWRLFIDSSKRSLKCVLLHNGNKLASVPIGHSIQMKETYENMKSIPDKIKYAEHEWVICGDLKVLSILLGQQGGNTKYPCFLCLWDSRAKQDQWIKRKWPSRKVFILGEKNIKNIPLVNREKILLPPLHIKLGLIKQFVKALDKEAKCFKYLCTKFPRLTYEKIKAGIFDGPQIRLLVKDQTFISIMKKEELNAWKAFCDVVKNFLGKIKSPNFNELVESLLQAFHNLRCNMSVKIHFLHSHLSYFPENLGAFSEEQGKSFHQDIKVMEKRYRGKWNVSMIADYCWNLIRESSDFQHSRQSKKRKLLP